MAFEGAGIPFVSPIITIAIKTLLMGGGSVKDSRVLNTSDLTGFKNLKGLS